MENRPNGPIHAIVYRCYHPDERRFVNHSQVNTMTVIPKVARQGPMCKIERFPRPNIQMA